MIDVANIHGKVGQSPRSIPAPEVLSLLVRHGAVAFRGFECDTREFTLLSQMYGDRFTCDPTKMSSNSWQTAQGFTGRLARAAVRVADRLSLPAIPDRRANDTRAAPFKGYGLNPHNENTFLPAGCPDLIWFLCQHRAADGGRSVLCDGTEMLAVLPDDARDYLSQVPIRFRLSYDMAQWRSVYGVSSESELRSVLGALENLEYDIDADGTLSYVFDTIQVAPTLFGDTPAVKTNLLSRRPYGETGSEEREQTADGDPVPSWLIEALLEAVVSQRAFVDLHDGDVILIDNSRILHGREPFQDTTRRLLTRLCWLKPDLADQVN
jgi:alpha-ketoglutarate-dependent taurine dioxygenase